MKTLNSFLKLNTRIILSILLTIGCARNNHHRTDVGAAVRITQLLQQARNLSGLSTTIAEQKVKEALKEAQQSGQKQLIVEGLILLGEISTHQGENKDALDCYIQSLKFAQNIQYVQGVCEAKNAIGEIYYDWGEYDKSFLYFLEVSKIAGRYKYIDCLAFAHNMIGKYYHTIGDFQKAKAYYIDALEYNQRTHDEKRAAIILTDRAKNYISMGKLNLALQDYMEAYKACEKLNDKIVYATVCDHLGAFYRYINQDKLAIHYYLKALACRKFINNPDGIAKSYNNIGILFSDQGRMDSAYYYFEYSLNISQKTGYKKGIIKSLTNLGKVCQAQHKLENSKDFLQEALKLANQSGYASGIAEASLSLGNHYKALHEPYLAIPMFTLSIKKINESNLYDIIRDDYLGLYECYQWVGDVTQALHYHILLFDIEKKLLNTENNKQLAILQVSFDLERKEIDNNILRKDNDLKEMTIKRESAFLWLIIVALGFTVLLCILIYSRFKSKQRANKTLESLNIKILKQNETLEKLNDDLEKANQEKDIVFSIITHELRNPLYWFQNLVEVLSKKHQTMKPEKVQKSLRALDESAKNAFHLMDNLLNWSRSRLKRITPKKNNHSLLSMISEVAQMYETILQHKEIRFQMKVFDNAKVFVDPDLFTCVLRNLISNAIKFTLPNGIISLECMEDEKEFIVMVSDSGKGIEGEDLRKIFAMNEYFSSPGLMQEKGSGLGLKICMEFVELNNGKIWVNSSPNKGTSFYFTVPKAVPLMDLPLKTDSLIESLQQS